MDSRIGPERGWNQTCAYNTSPTFELEHECGRTPVVRHFLFKELDEHGFHPGTMLCEQHQGAVPLDIILLTHPVGPFCSMGGSIWDYELNECTMPLDKFEEVLFGEKDFAKDLLDEFSELNSR